MTAFLIILIIVVVGWYLKNGRAPKATHQDNPNTEQGPTRLAIIETEESAEAQDLLSEDKIVIKYKNIDASDGAYSYILLLLLCAIPAFFYPMIWIFVILGFLIILPLNYYYDRKQQKKVKNQEPALTIDGTILTYDRKTIDLSQMDRAIMHPDIDYDGNILIYQKGKRSPRMNIYTDNMLINRDELLKVIQERIKGS